MDQTHSPPSSSQGGCCPMTADGIKSYLFWGVLLLLLGGYVVMSRQAAPPAPKGFTWVEGLDAGLARAKAAGQPVFVKFYATWCGPCQYMDREVFSRDDVADALAGWVPVKVDVDKHPRDAAQYHVQGIPLLVTLNSDGQVLGRQEGALPPAEFIGFLKASRQRLAGQ